MTRDPSRELTRRELLGSTAAVAVGAAVGLADARAFGTEGAAPAATAPAATPAAATPSLANLTNGQAAWQAFCEALRPLAARIDSAFAGGDPVNEFEGIRCLSRLVALGFDRFLEHADPLHPSFYDLQTPTRKYLGDNPDQTYRTAAIAGGHTYRIEGDLTGAVGVEVGVYAGDFRSDDPRPGGGRRLVASCDERALEIGPDGRFTLTLGPDAAPAANATESGRSTPSMKPTNRLATADDANTVLIRTYFHDRALRSHHAMPTIERVGPAAPTRPLDLSTLARGLLASAAFVDGSLAFWRTFEGFKSNPNTLIKMPDDGTVQTPRLVRYINGWVELGPDEAFLMEFNPRDEPVYWSWVLQNVWGETPDWRLHPVVLNNREVHRGTDGRVTIAVSHRKPTRSGIDWLDLAGHRRALLSLRWRGESALPEIRSRVVRIEEIAQEA